VHIHTRGEHAPRGSSLFILQSPSPRSRVSLNGLRNHTLRELAKGRRERRVPSPSSSSCVLLLLSVAGSAGRTAADRGSPWRYRSRAHRESAKYELTDGGAYTAACASRSCPDTQQRQRPDTLFPLRLIVPLLALFFLPFKLSLLLSPSLSLSLSLSLFLSPSSVGPSFSKRYTQRGGSNRASNRYLGIHTFTPRDSHRRTDSFHVCVVRRAPARPSPK